MSHSFGATSTTDEVLQGIDLTAKRVLVTGVSAGLGVETARALAAHGAQVVGAARDLSKAQTATEARNRHGFCMLIMSRGWFGVCLGVSVAPWVTFNSAATYILIKNVGVRRRHVSITNI